MPEGLVTRRLLLGGAPCGGKFWLLERMARCLRDEQAVLTRGDFDTPAELRWTPRPSDLGAISLLTIHGPRFYFADAVESLFGCPISAVAYVLTEADLEVEQSWRDLEVRTLSAYRECATRHAASWTEIPWLFVKHGPSSGLFALDLIPVECHESVILVDRLTEEGLPDLIGQLVRMASHQPVVTAG